MYREKSGIAVDFNDQQEITVDFIKTQEFTVDFKKSNKKSRLVSLNHTATVAINVFVVSTNVSLFGSRQIITIRTRLRNGTVKRNNMRIIKQ